MMTASKHHLRVPTPNLDITKTRGMLSLKALTLLCLAVAEASSSQGHNGNFLVMSEVMVPLTMQNGNQNDQKQSDNRGAGSSGSGRETSANDASTTTATVTPGSGNTSHDAIGVNNLPASSSGNELSSSAGGGGSDTDGEEEDIATEQSSSFASAAPPQTNSKPAASSTESASVSQPLRTLKRLQAMLDDSDYATSAVSPASVVDSHNLDQVNDAMLYSDTTTDTNNQSQQQQTIIPASNTDNNDPQEKLWTRQDRAKYRRTRRAEKQRRDYEEQRMQQYREMERERIVRQERERKELEDLRRKQMEVMELQRREAAKREAMQRQILYEEEFTDDETDTDGVMGFELPNLPVYLSDGETDDFSEEGDDLHHQARSNRPPGLGSYGSMARRSAQVSPQRAQPQRDFRQPSNNGPQPYQYGHPRNAEYNYRRAQQRGQHQPQRQVPSSQFDYRQPPPHQQQQHGGYATNNFAQQGVAPHQYQYNPNHQQPREHEREGAPQLYQLNPNQQQMEQQQQQYQHQYAAWAQAAANGYYYPLPVPPAGQQQHARHDQQSTQNQQYAHNVPYQTNGPNQGYVQSPYTSSYPSFLPQQRAAPPPESQASQAIPMNQRPGTQGFFSRDNQVAQAWLQQQQFSSNTGAVLDLAQQQIQNTDYFTPESSHAVVPTVSSSQMGAELQGSTEAMMEGASVATTAEIISPLISTAPDRIMSEVNAEGPYCELKDESAVVIAGAESKINFDSIQKLVFSSMGIALLSYCAVSPRSLPFPEYNRLFLQNLFTVGLGAFPQLITLLCVYDGKYNNINTVIGTFHVSFTLGYILAFISEIIVTTLLRLGVFLLWEPAIFSLTPEVPTIILPWVLREKHYRPKRITLFACDFGASCVASPIIEEYLKLKIVQWTAFLPRNFKSRPKPHKGKRRKKDTLQPIIRDYDEVTNINCYVSQMMAASLGLKLFDTTRRILMYTKESDDYKNFYAICRGVFPIHELCGTMTALLLARRDVLGVHTPLWKILGPAVFIHGMANFRGMKPIFKWGSSTPWSEMQLYPWKVGTNFTVKQLLSTSYAKIVWCTILLRVFGFCVKNYYLIGRQAMKRATTYSGKLYAFSAKLETDAVLKRAKE